MNPAASLDTLARSLLVAAGSRSNVYVGSCFGVKHREQWSRYVSGVNSPTASTLQGWLEAWAEYAAANSLPPLSLTWTAKGCTAG
jgi:hypothetical protein